MHVCDAPPWRPTWYATRTQVWPHCARPLNLPTISSGASSPAAAQRPRPPLLRRAPAGTLYSYSAHCTATVDLYTAHCRVGTLQSQHTVQPTHCCPPQARSVHRPVEYSSTGAACAEYSSTGAACAESHTSTHARKRVLNLRLRLHTCTSLATPGHATRVRLRRASRTHDVTPCLKFLEANKNP